MKTRKECFLGNNKEENPRKHHSRMFYDKLFVVNK